MDDEQPSPGSVASRSRGRLRIAVVLTLLAAVVVLAALQATGVARFLGEPSTAPLPARIAVVDNEGALATMDDRGGSIVAHPVDGVAFEFPAWSPDGSRVAAIGNGTNEGGVYVFDGRGVTAGEPAVIYRSAEQTPFYLYWTLDSRQVTFLTTELEGLALRIAPADGGAPGAIIRNGAPLYWDWSGLEHVLVNVGGGGPDAYLGEIGLDGVADPPTERRPGAFRAPVVSHDGSHRAYVIATDGGSEAIVVRSRDGAVRHEIPIPGTAAIGFEPEGGNVAFIAPSVPGPSPGGLPIGPLRLVDVATGAVRTLLDGSIVAFFWSPDSKTIATLRIPSPGEEDVAVSRAHIAGAAANPVAAASPGFGLRLGFVDVETGEVRAKQEVRVSELFALQVLPFFDQYALSHRFWSPDSTAILLPVVGDDGVEAIALLPADGSDPRQIAAGRMGAWSP